MTRLVAISNRVPLPRRATTAGGLVQGVLAAMQVRGGLWFGWSGEIAPAAPGAARVLSRDRVSYATVDLSQADHDDYYVGFCNGALWPLFHYFLDAVRYHDEQYAAYLRVNQRMALGLAPLLRPDDLLWVHDYHLIPLARALRGAGARQPLGFFLHIPFPHIEALRALPVHDELMRLMLDYDFIAFQTVRDLECFRSAAVDLWGPHCLKSGGRIVARGRTTVATHIPIGIDVDAVHSAAVAAQGADAVKRMMAGLVGRQCVIGIDRLDYSKGLVERFDAYDRFLAAYPEYQGRVTYLQIAPLSRSDVRAYQHIRTALEQAAGRTNGRFADTDWTPIRYLNRNFPHQVVMGFLRTAQVGLVTPLRDGMNLVAKEFVAAQDEANPGVLVLSTLAGAARELDAALLVNPKDTGGMARAIRQALQMSLAERRERHRQLLQTLRRSDLTAWHTLFTDGLLAARARSTEDAYSHAHGDHEQEEPECRRELAPVE